MSSDAVRLKSIRSKLAALGNVQWFMSVDDRGTFLEVKNSNGELNEVARFHSGALPEEMELVTSAPYDIGFLIQLVDRCSRALKTERKRNSNQSPDRSKNFAAEAAMRCEEPAFKVFLEQKHGLERPLTADRVAQKLRSILGIQSRKELNQNGAAAQRWRDLRADFEAWRRVGR